MKRRAPGHSAFMKRYEHIYRNRSNANTFTFAEDTPMRLDNGESLGPITLAYETYGQLNTEGSNAILICHALSGDSHVAGYYTDEDPAPVGGMSALVQEKHSTPINTS